MRRAFVTSTSIASVGYDPTSETLEVEFTNGSLYQYFDVPDAVHERLMTASSKGRFLNLFIRDRYAYSRIE